MTRLGEIDKIAHNISNSALKAVKALHVVAYGNEGEPRKIRKSLCNFSGFGFDEDSDDFIQKIGEVKQKLELPDLIAICHVLDLDYSGSNDSVVARICSFMNDLKVSDEEDEEKSEEDDREEECDDDRSDVGSIASPRRKKTEKQKMDSFALTFRDVEDTIRHFNGEDDYPIEKWISDFEEMAEITGWNDLQKLIFAKRSLEGLAKLFVRSEKGIKTWEILKKKLMSEFEIKVSSAEIHKLLLTRKKKHDETVQEYTLVMREIGSRANIENEVVMQYIIDGIPDDSSNKIVLYGAKNFTEFKDKVKLYEKIQKRKPKVPSGRDAREKREDKSHESKNVKAKTDVCFNCGEKGHKSKGCPHANKGTKCFSCQGFGHVAKKCPKKQPKPEEPSTSSTVSTIEVIPTNSVKVTIDGIQLLALMDTGSDISAIRSDVYSVYFHDVLLDKTFITVKGIGNNKVLTLGSFNKKVLLNDEEVTLKIHILPTEATNFKCIVGSDVLSQVDIKISEGEIMVLKKEKENFLRHITVDSEKSQSVDLSHIEEEKDRNRIKKLIEEYEPNKTKTTDVKMKIILRDEEPVYHRPRRLSVSEKEEVEAQIEEWLQEGIIRPSSSDFASALVLVKKKDGKTRICCDYRALNRKIVKDRFPLPLIEDVLDNLQDAKYFTTIDLRNGFFHVAIEEDSVKYTSFVTHNGQYEFLKCPFGLCNSPAVFQRFICQIFRELTAKKTAIYYMDDVIIPSSTEEEGISRLENVLEVARDYGLEIKKKKCQFLKTRVCFLGFIIEGGKVQPSEEKTDAIRRFPMPTTSKQVQSFLGLTGYFRKFIPSYALIAKPLSDMLRRDSEVEFGEKQIQCFEELKRLLCSEPVLHIYKPGRITELHTDASKHGYGACLMQKSNEDGMLHPIYYASKKTTPAEEKYHSYELEVLAIVTALKKFRIYLLGFKFKIITDCAAFQKTMCKKDLTTRVARWALLLEEFSYEIEHRRGNRMLHVDALSRNPVMMTLTHTLLSEGDGILNRVKLAQDKDEHIQAIKKIISMTEYEDYYMKSGIVYKYDKGNELIVVPKMMQHEIIRRSHEIGHFRVPKTKEIIKREFYIPKLTEKIKACIRNCVLCILSNKKEGKKEGWLHPIAKSDLPLHTYHADHLGPLTSTNKNYNHILAVIDDFSKFVWLYPTKSTTSLETVNCLRRQQQTFGNPHRIITDKGTAFTGQEFQEYCSGEGIEHVLVTTGVPRGNGQIERVNRTIIPILTKLSLDDPTKWYKHVDKVQLVLNSTRQRSIDATPFEVLFGVKLRSQEDIQIKELMEIETIEQFCKDRDDLRVESQKQILKVQEENKRNYNLRRRTPKRYKIGELVAIKRTQLGPGLKLKIKFFGPYEVVAVKPNDRYDVIKVGDHEGPQNTSTCAEYMKPWVENQSESELSESGSDSESG